MIELKLGFMTTAELAEWGNISLDYLQDRKKTWCQKQLSKYANYSLKRGGVEIIEIYNPIFMTSGKKEVQEKYLHYWGTENYLVDSNKECWEKMRSHLTNSLADSTGRSYVSQARVEDFGPAYKKKQRNGTKGYCHYIFCKIVDGIPQPFTEKEEEIRKELSKKYLCSREEEAYEMQALLRDFQNGNLSKEEYCSAVSETIATDKGWINFQTAFENAIGYCTDFKIKLEPRAWEEPKSGEFKW